MLSGWLYQAARFTAANFIKHEARRRQREQEVDMTSASNEMNEATWREITPLLDEAMGRLGGVDRDALVLRFFENKSAAEIGAALRMTEETARKRVNRALEKLRKVLAKRGVKSTAVILAGAISTYSVHAAPGALAGTASAAAIAKGAASSTSTITLIKGALKIMAWTKAKTAVVASVIVLLVTTTATVIVKEIQAHRTYPWQKEGHDSRVLDEQPPQVRILPSKARYASWGKNTDRAGQAKLMGTGVPAKTVVLAAYQFDYPTRVTGSGQLPDGKFDYIGSLPTGNEKALQKEAKKRLGVTARIETRKSDVLLLQVRNDNPPGLKTTRGDSQNGGGFTSEPGSGKWSCKNSPLSSLAYYLENLLQVPVLDQTGLTNTFDITLSWDQPDRTNKNPEGLKRAVLDQLGLDLIPTNLPCEMLVIEKPKS